MSVTDRREQDTEGELGDLPVFEISYLLDDRENPTEVTVFPGTEDYDLSTHWITIDAGHAVPLEDVR